MRLLLALAAVLAFAGCDAVTSAPETAPAVAVAHADTQCPTGQVRVCSPGDRGVVCTCMQD